MNYAKKLGQKMVKARASARSGGMRAGFMQTSAGQRHGNVRGMPVPTKPTALGEPAIDLSRGRGGGRQPGYGAPSGRGGKYNGPWKGASSGPAAPGSSMGFGKGYKQTYAESHVHGEPTKALRKYRKRQRTPVPK